MPTYHAIPIKQNQLLAEIDKKSYAMCAGMVLATMKFFYKTTAEELSSTLTGFFSKREQPIYDYAVASFMMQNKFIKSKGCIKTAVEEIFFNSQTNKVSNTIDDITNLLEFFRGQIQEGTSAICTSAYLINKITQQPEVHLVGLLNFKEQLLFIEPNYGLYFFDTVEDFELWFMQESSIGGILAYLYKHPENTDVKQQKGLARTYTISHTHSYAFELTEKPQVSDILPPPISSRIKKISSML